MREKGREKIMAAALKLFAEKGYYSSSMDDVVKKAKVSKGSAYHYFESKEALLEAVVAEGIGAFSLLLEKVEGERSALGKLEALINISFDMLKADTRFWKLYFSLLTQMTLPKSIKKALAPVLTDLFVYMKALMEEMGVEDPALESKILGAVLDGVFLHYILIGNEYPLEEMRRKIINRYR